MTEQHELAMSNANAGASGWLFARKGDAERSLSEVNSTIPVPRGLSWAKHLLAFSGPGYMVAVGYMDPGNWATDIAGGSKFGYTLLSVIMISNLMAILLQALAARLGIAADRDLAQACSDAYPRPVGIALWLLMRAGALRRPGLTIGAFAVGYSMARIVCEFFREPDPQLGFLWGGLTMGMLLSVPLLLTGLAFMFAAWKRPALRA